MGATSAQVTEYRMNALLPRLYRYEFNRDMIKDFDMLRERFFRVIKDRLTDSETQFTVEDLQIFSQLAYIMTETDKDFDEWYESFDGTIYSVFPVLLEIWSDNEKITAVSSKRSRPTTRETTGAVFMLRCAELGLTDEQLKTMTMGMVSDMLIERANDSEEYPYKATAEDIKSFFG